MEPNFAEAAILAILRDLKPFESITIVADKMGKPNTFLVTNSRKVIITAHDVVPVR